MIENAPFTMTLIVFVFLLILAIAWILLPFAMFGMKSRLDRLIHETRKTNALLEQQSRSENR